MGNPTDLLRHPGQVIQNRYRIEELAGRGTFAEVHRACDTYLNRDVAIKLMNPRVKKTQGVDSEKMQAQIITRFQREAQAVAVLQCPETVSLYDFGTTQDGVLFMVHEYINGPTLKEAIQTRGPFEAQTIAEIMVQALKSLREAHALGILHRDVKPENIMLFDAVGEKDLVRLVDFGIAKAVEDEGEALTAAGMLVGTPRYVAPERVKQSELTPASDLYSLGACAYYMACGEEIYAGLDTMSMLREKIAPSEIVVPENIGIPNDLKGVINRMLFKHPDARFGSAQQAIDELDRFLITYKLQHDPKLAHLLEEIAGAPTQHLPAVEGAMKVERNEEAGFVPGGAEMGALPSLRTQSQAPNTTVPTEAISAGGGGADEIQKFDPDAAKQAAKKPSTMRFFMENPIVVVVLILIMTTFLMMGIGVGIVIAGASG